MDLHKLHIFVTIARLASFSHAAETLHMTQPTVSQQLAILEASLGVKLIERDTRHLRLTAAGDALLPRAEALLTLADEAAEASRAAAGLADRTLRLGVGHTLATYLLPDLLSRYRARHVQNLVRITAGNTSELLSAVAANQIELALVGSPAVYPEITATPFMQDRLVVIVAPDDQWVGRPAIDLQDLRGRVLLTREPGSALHASVERLLGSTALAGDSAILLGETEAIKRCVEAGLGVALIQAIAVEREVKAGNLCALPLSGADDSRTYLVAQRQRHELSAAARGLVELLGIGQG